VISKIDGILKALRRFPGVVLFSEIYQGEKCNSDCSTEDDFENFMDAFGEASN
jgi:hypothetical protein